MHTEQLLFRHIYIMLVGFHGPMTSAFFALKKGAEIGGMIVCFGLCPCQHNGTYTWNVYPATPTKKPAQFLLFAESENEPLSRIILGKAAQNALGKGTGPSNLPKPIWASFCHASKNGCKKAQKSFCFPLQGHKLSPLCEGADFSAPSSCSLRLMPGIE